MSQNSPTDPIERTVELSLQPQKPKRRWGLWLFALCVLLLVGAFAAWKGAEWFVNSRPIPFSPTLSPALSPTLSEETPSPDAPLEVKTPNSDPAHPTFVIVAVREGDHSLSVAEKLRHAGFDFPNWAMKLSLRLHPNSLAKLHQGRYKIATNVTPAALLDTFGRGTLIEGVLRIPDGAPLWEVRALFNDAKELTHKTAEMTDAELASALGLPYTTPEGFFAPDTYRYMEGGSDLEVMKLAVKRQEKLLTRLWEERDATVQVKTPYEALTLASIIEKESGLSEDRGKISSVFHNRLSKAMPLQTDPTVIYGLGPSFNGNLTKKDLQTETPYNTYRIAALPPTPIGAPSAASLRAALHPEATPYLYFVSRGDGSSEFSTNLAAHNRAVNKFLLKPRTKPAGTKAPSAKN